MVSVGIQNALAATLVNDGMGVLDGRDGEPPLAIDAWLDGLD